MLDRATMTSALALAGIYYFLLPSPALAYWDLNFGTYLLQLIFAFGATFWLSFKHSWTKRWKGKKAPETEPTGAGEEPQ